MAYTDTSLTATRPHAEGASATGRLVLMLKEQIHKFMANITTIVGAIIVTTLIVYIWTNEVTPIIEEHKKIMEIDN